MYIQMYLYFSNFRVWKVCDRLSNIIIVRYVIKKLVGILSTLETAYLPIEFLVKSNHQFTQLHKLINQ